MQLEFFELLSGVKQTQHFGHDECGFKNVKMLAPICHLYSTCNNPVLHYRNGKNFAFQVHVTGAHAKKLLS